MTDDLPRRATPEEEDFFGKYESSGRIGRLLVDHYFEAVDDLIGRAGREMQIGRALEIGCGPGLSTQKLRELLPRDAELEASEYVPALVEAARANNPGVQIEQEDIYDLQRPDGNYDVVFLLEVLEHLDYPDRALAELGRILKPHGLLILGVPREPIWRALNMARGKYWRSLGNTPGHLNRWSTRAIRSYVGANIGDVLETRTPLPWTLLLVRARG